MRKYSLCHVAAMTIWHFDLKIPNAFGGGEWNPEHELWEDLEIPVQMGPINEGWFPQLRNT